MYNYAVWWKNSDYWPLFVTRVDGLELDELMEHFVYELDPHGRGIILL